MKRTLLLCMVILSFVYTTNTGCSKLAGGDIILPDVSSLSIVSMTPFIPGDSIIVGMYSSSLTAGVYTIHYSLSGANVLSGLTRILVMNNDSGSFTIPALTNPGNTTLYISEITSPSGGNANLMKNNLKTFSDSLGLMTAAISGVGAYRAIHVTAVRTGNLLTIQGIYWSPLKTITLNIDNYTGATGAVSFNVRDLTNVNGNALYVIPNKIDSSAHGVITITNTAPLITGTFSFTNRDSSTISSGTFSCPAP